MFLIALLFFLSLLMPAVPPRSLGVDAAADYLGISTRTLRRLVARREIGHRRVGKALLVFSVNDLNTWLDAERVEPTKRGA